MDFHFLLRLEIFLLSVLIFESSFQNNRSNGNLFISSCYNDIFSNILTGNNLENHINLKNNHFRNDFVSLSENNTLSIASSSLNESAKKEEMPSFDEWKEKEKEKTKNGESDIQAVHGNVKLKGSKQINFASITCGAKIVYVNPEAQNPAFILFENKDQYMINPCKLRKTITIEMCEAIQIQSIELGNLELFSSLPEKFEVYISERFPSKEWTLLGSFHSIDERSIQTFPIDTNNIYAKYLRVDFLSHYGNEHYCPLTVLRVFGLTMDEDDDVDVLEIVDEESLSLQQNPADATNLFSSAKNTVISLVNNVLRSKNLEENNNSITDVKHHDVINDNNDSFASSSKDSDTNLTINNKYLVFENFSKPKVPYPNIIDTNENDLTDENLNIYALWKFRCNLNDDKHQSYIICHYLHLLDSEFIFNSQSIYITNNQPSGPNFNDTITVSDIPKSVINVTNVMPLHTDNPNETSILTAEHPNIQNNSSYDEVKVLNEKEKADEQDRAFNKTLNEAATSMDQPFILVGSETRKDIYPSIISKLEPLYDDSNMEEITYQKLSSRGKETIFLKLKNRIKSLEHNLNLTTRYLDELTQSLKRQMEEMNNNINTTTQNHMVSSALAKNKSTLQQEEILLLQANVSSLVEILNNLNRTEKAVQKSVLAQHTLMIIIEISILFLSIFIFKIKYLNPLYRQMTQNKTQSNNHHPINVQNIELPSDEDIGVNENIFPTKYKKEKSTDCDSALMPLLCVHG